MNEPKYLIIHHTATLRDKTTFQAVKNYHISKGWGDIAYHYFITADGTTYDGRKEKTVGAHCRADNMNYRSIGICLTGNFEKEKPTEEQLGSLLSVIKVLRNEYNIPKDNVLGHGSVAGAKTLCPGKNLIDWLVGYLETDEDSVKHEKIKKIKSLINEAKSILNTI